MNLTARQKYDALKMTRAEFASVLARNWEPKELTSAEMPGFLEGLSAVKMIKVFGSGSAEVMNSRTPVPMAILTKARLAESMFGERPRPRMEYGGTRTGTLSCATSLTQTLSTCWDPSEMSSIGLM